MATGVVNSANYLTGPGILYTAPLLTAEPTSTVTGSVFGTTWTTWLPVGSTADGWSFSDEITVENIEASETYYPVRRVTTGRAAEMTVVLQEYTISNLKRALNTGTVTTTGSGATMFNEIVPPAVGAEVRLMWGWQSEDNTVRFIAGQALQTGNIGTTFTKGATTASLSLTLGLELPPAVAFPYKIQTAGATRGA